MQESIQIRYLDTIPDERVAGQPVQSLIPIGSWASIEEFWEKGLSQNLRKKIRRAERDGLQVKGERSNEAFEVFYGLYLKTMHRHGTPPYSREIMHRLHDRLDAEIVRVEDGDGEVVAAYLVIRAGNITLFQWAGFNAMATLGNASALGEWQAIKKAMEKGCDWFDLGRSSDGGPAFKHKQYWKPEVYRCCVYPPIYKSVYSKYSLASKVWRLLPPAFAAKIGPAICQRLKDA